MALITCPECEGTVSDKAVSCPHCGWPIEKPIAAFSVEEHTFDQRGGTPWGKAAKPGASPKMGKPFWRGDRPAGFGCLAVIALIIAAIMLYTNYRDSRSAYVPNEADAYVVATTHLKRTLKARTKVRFDSVEQADVYRMDRNTFRFNSNFHIQNDKDSRTDKPFTVIVRFNGKGENDYFDWELVELKY